MNEVRGIVLRPNGEREWFTMDKDDWQELDSVLGCRVFTSVRPFAGNQYAEQVSIFVDDEGLLHPDSVGNIWSCVICPIFEIPQILFGNIVLLGGADEHGDVTDLHGDIVNLLPPSMRPSPELQITFENPEDE